MSVEVEYIGDCGNNFFQYFTARIFADKNALKMVTKPTAKMLEIMDINHDDNEVHELEEKVIRDPLILVDNEIPYDGLKRYKFEGYFQNAPYMNANYDLIMSYINRFNFPSEIVKRDGILLYIRLGDHFRNEEHSEIVHPDYYKEIASEYTKVRAIVYPNNEWYKEKYMKAIGEVEEIGGTMLEDFYAAWSYETICIGSSTLHWWIGYFSESKKVYTCKNMGSYGVDRIYGRDHVKELYKIREKWDTLENGYVNVNGFRDE